ncbi:MAG: hypothetical protein ACK5NE_09475 [Brachymonas sp.]
MATTRTLQRSFAGGELSPEMFGRIDDAKYHAGLSLCRNFIVKPQGPVENRPGFQFVREVKDSDTRVRLIPFTYSTTQTMVIEMGAGYFRFHTQGGTLLVLGGPYEVENPYLEDELFDVHYVQSADVLTLVHPNHNPMELRRLGPTEWTLEPVSFAPVIAPPSGVSAIASGHTAPGKYDYRYVVTSVQANGITESEKSAEATTKGNVYETGGIVTITWTPAPGAIRYHVYKDQGGLFGYIGETEGVSLVDDNIAPDLSRTPPRHDNAMLISGRIMSVPVTTGGINYGSALGALTGASVTNGGSYPLSGSLPTTFPVKDPNGSGGTVNVTWETKTVVGTPTYRVLKTVTVASGGSGYVDPSIDFGDLKFGRTPKVAFTKAGSEVTLKVTDVGEGKDAVLKPEITGGVITGVTVVNPGSNYYAPVVSVDFAGGGTGAVFGVPDVQAEGDYPGAVSYFEQRRVFAGTRERPQSVVMTRSGTEADMSFSLPIRDDDRISFRVAAREANAIRHIVPLAQLLLLTSAAEWRVATANTDVLTPTSIGVRPQSYIGASNVQPLIVNNTLIFCASRGGHVHEMAYNWQANGFQAGDLSLRSVHLFDNLEIVDMAYAKAPQPVAWFVSSSGTLLGLTYVPEQQVGAWHRHETDGVFESCTVVAEGFEDVLYVVVRREIDGNPRRYVERLASRQFVRQEDAFFVDCGLTYSGPPADEISGLDHLEGKEVSILADGAVHPRRTVTEGRIALDHEASTVHVGLPIVADLHTLPMVIQMRDASFGQGRVKNVNKVWLRVHRSSGIFIGPDSDSLVEAKQRTTEPPGSPPALKSEEIPIVPSPSWSDGGQVYVRQKDPLPLMIVGLTAEVAVGG